MARIGPGDIELTMDELRLVARYAVTAAEDVLGLFEQVHPADRRPRAAVEAAWAVVDGAERSRRQRVTALDAHRAARSPITGNAITRDAVRSPITGDTGTGDAITGSPVGDDAVGAALTGAASTGGTAAVTAAAHAAHAAGDAAAAAYLHPLAQATQVGHILRAAAHAARATEVAAGDAPRVGDEHLERARLRATPELVDVLRRYPPAPSGRSRVAALMSALDTALRSS
ncbi:hypothetical protein SAMN05216207_1005239 [Pseudonocardia ammonioxydans]|uniref:Imm-5-like domain-containing protein n=1 Tax=Pseudonocardia ammonioxydans TaxID=260086 RepID=A0A1I4V8T1_PSUAM|nr:exonuclease SbcC [Pseudonocardia ammonioxydans]SFM97571.1 hypothetical protein SAMN05216207_1005239 [Pseudonocardia ammonioxydans]